MQRHGLHRTQTPLRHNTQIPPRHPCLKTGAFRNARSVKDEPWLPKLNPAAAARYDALVTCCASSNGPTHLPGIHHDDPQPKTRRPSLRPPSMRRAPSPLLSINIYLYELYLIKPYPSPASTTTTPMSTRPHRPTPSRSCAGTMLHKAGATVAHLHARRVATPVASAARLVRVLVLLHRRHGSALGHAMRRGQHVGLAFRSWVVPFPKGV